MPSYLTFPIWSRKYTALLLDCFDGLLVDCCEESKEPSVFPKQIHALEQYLSADFESMD